MVLLTLLYPRAKIFRNVSEIAAAKVKPEEMWEHQIKMFRPRKLRTGQTFEEYLTKTNRIS